MSQSDPKLYPGSNESTPVQTERQYLEASLKIQMDESCVVSAFEENVSLIDILPDRDTCVTEFLTDDISETCDEIRRQGGHCECGDSLTDRPDDAVVRASLSRKDQCICDIFKKFGCSPRIKGRDSGYLLIDTYLPDRETLSDLIEQLQLKSSHVQVTRIQEVTPSDKSDRHASIDLSNLTATQRICLDKALEKGYFDDPRSISQTELAEELGISPSAVSRRLRAIEKQLFEQVKADVGLD